MSEAEDTQQTVKEEPEESPFMQKFKRLSPAWIFSATPLVETLSTSWNTSCRPSWSRTSPVLQQAAEKALLSLVRKPYEIDNVIVNEDTGEYIHTLKMGSGPPLVLLHGFGSGIGLWLANLDALSSRNTIYAIDLPGFAGSSRSLKSLSTPDEAENYFVDYIETWRQKIGLDKFNLLGHSFGGYVSSIYSLKHPQSVNKLILADCWGIPEKPQRSPDDPSRPNSLLRFALKQLSNYTPLATLRASGPFGPYLIASLRKDILNKFTHIFPDHKLDTNNPVLQYIYHSNTACPPTGELGFHQLSIPIGWAKTPLIHRLKKLSPKIQTTFLYGDSTWMDPNAAIHLSKKMKGKTNLFVIPDSGHHVYIDNPRAFNDLINQITTAP